MSPPTTEVSAGSLISFPFWFTSYCKMRRMDSWSICPFTQHSESAYCVLGTVLDKRLATVPVLWFLNVICVSSSDACSFVLRNIFPLGWGFRGQMWIFRFMIYWITLIFLLSFSLFFSFGSRSGSEPSFYFYLMWLFCVLFFQIWLYN